MDPDAVGGDEWDRARHGCIRFCSGDRRRGRGSLGNLLRRCVNMRITIELSFGVVSGVGPGIHVLDGSPRASRGTGCFWHGF